MPVAVALGVRLGNTFAQHFLSCRNPQVASAAFGSWQRVRNMANLRSFTTVDLDLKRTNAHRYPNLRDCLMMSTSTEGESTVPVTVLSGFLGAGKTTLLNHILSDQNHGRRLAIVVNDMAEVNIDADLVVRSSSTTAKDGSASTPEQKMVQLQNGCICCTLRDDLVLEVAGLARQGEIDHIVVESTGVSEPLPVAQTFSAPIKNAHEGVVDDGTPSTELPATYGLKSLNDVAHLHSLVTVVDCSTFLTHLDSADNLTELGMAAAEGDTRPLAFLLADQVQFANLILVNKTDLVDSDSVDKVESLLRHLNPSATIRRTQHSAIDVPELLAKQAYDESTFSRMPEWAEELAKGDNHTPETQEYGIGHFSLRVIGRPFHPKRWHELMMNKDVFDGVIRAKGCFWTTAEPNTRMEFSTVGNMGNLVVNQVWASAGIDMVTDQAFRLKTSSNSEDDAAHDKAVAAAAVERLTAKATRLQAEGVWHPVTHDRRVDLVFIGDATVMDEARIRSAIEEALLTKDELHDFLRTFGSAPTDDIANPFAYVPRCVVI